MGEINVSVNSLMDENKDLRFEIEEQLKIIESQKQVIHTAMSRIDCLSKMKLEMEIEIDALTGLHQIKESLESKVVNLESELSSARLKCTNLEQNLKDEKNNYEEVIADLNNEISRLKEDNSCNDLNEKKHQELLSKISSLQDKNKDLMETNEELQIQNKALSEQNVMLEMSLSEKTRALEEMNDIIGIKSNDLKSAQKQIEELQGEKAVLSAELNSLKCQPASPSKRGNSLFAEVEDKRVSVAKRLEAMQNKYKELKKSFFKKNAELRALEAENIELRRQWKESQNDPYKNAASLVESYQTRIQELSQMVSILEKRPETPQIISVSEVTNVHVNVVKGLIDEERETNRKLRNEMEQRSIRELDLNKQLFDLRNKMRALKSQSMSESVKIAELKLQIEDLKNKENIPEQQSAVIPKKMVRMAD